MNEDRLIAWLRKRTGGPRRGGRGIGDDAAVVPGDGEWAITMDTQIAGVHFLETSEPTDVAHRLLAVNLSDLAAMGAEPAYVFLALAAPRGFDHRRFFDAFLDSCDHYGVELAGGDLSSSLHATLVATVLGRRAGQRWVGRDDARAGEHLWLGGTVGEAALGWRLLDRGARLVGGEVRLPEDLAKLDRVARAARRAVRRQLRPRPQLDLGAWLGACTQGAAIDVSDGLARDLHRLCRASEVGAEIDLDHLPLPPHFRDLAEHLECNWRDLALGGGEDYVLLFTLPAGLEPPDRFSCSRIGSVHSGAEIYLRLGDQKEELPPLGWDHLEDACRSGPDSARSSSGPA